ncbi:Protein AAR2 -like protein [Trichinella pseudospiralis]|uniref:Protein AAR2 homolog n=1 Tax=Trichinella pseudospiralis TaxID=6337 RepID=A0A0V1KDZ9_TRIPS|nr:Protein AAR2 -like protein [Trichinella pseudospiralis]
MYAVLMLYFKILMSSSSRKAESAGSSTTVQMSPEEALQLFEYGAFALFPDLPNGFEFGVDYNAWSTGPKFKGIKMIPPGVHFIYVSSLGKHGDRAPRIGFFHNFAPKEILVKKWDKENEDLADENDVEQVERLRLNLKEMDQFLGPYPFENHKQWFSLSYLINESLINRLSPTNGKISSQCDLISKESQDLSSGAQRVDRENPVRTRFRDAQLSIIELFQGLPIMNTSPESEIKFTTIPTVRSENFSPEERTSKSMDRSFALRKMLSTYEEPKFLLGELQFAYICFLLGHVYEAFEQWKRLIDMICNCDEALGEFDSFYSDFIMVLHFQLKTTPSEFFVDIVARNNFLTQSLSNFFSLVASSETVSEELKEKCRRFQLSVSAHFMWDFSEVRDEFAPLRNVIHVQINSENFVLFSVSVMMSIFFLKILLYYEGSFKNGASKYFQLVKHAPVCEFRRQILLDHTASQLAKTVVSFCNPPVRSLMLIANRTRRPSRSKPEISAAKPAAPEPSTINFSVSNNCNIATDMDVSETLTILSTKDWTVLKALQPNVGTAKPSASVGRSVTVVGFPAFIDSLKV